MKFTQGFAPAVETIPAIPVKDEVAALPAVMRTCIFPDPASKLYGWRVRARPAPGSSQKWRGHERAAELRRNRRPAPD
jgi:hypothetical protein